MIAVCDSVRPTKVAKKQAPSYCRVQGAKVPQRGKHRPPTATRTSRPEATLPNADVAGAGSSAHTEVTDAAPRVTEVTPGPATVPRHRAVVLPKLQIPTFSGALRDWQTFWDHFSATIHRNEDLLPIEKFKYLLSYLSGVAKRAIEGIRLTEDNYAIAIRTLTERFGRRDLLINEHIDHLLALPPFKSSADVDKLRLLYDKVQFRVSALTGLGVSPDQYNVVLNRVLMRCLPDDLAILYRQKSKEAAQNTSGIATPEERARQAAEMLSFLRIQIEVREEGRPGRTPSAFSRLLPEEDVEPQSAPMGHLPTASALAAESVPVTEEEVSVLLGSDVYWKVATGKVDHLTSNLTAMETKFGWTIQGTTERERSSAFPRCDRGGPPSQRRPFFRGCALQTARPPRYPRVLQGGSGGGFDGARGPRRGFRVRPPFHGNNDTSSRDYDHTRYGDCRDDAVDGPHSLPDRTQQGRPQWRQRGRSVTPPTQPSAWKENWRTRTSQGARSSNDRRGCWESRSFYYRSGSSDSETDRGRRHPSGESGRETMMATSSSRARSRNVAAENSHRVAARSASESRELTRGAKRQRESHRKRDWSVRAKKTAAQRDQGTRSHWERVPITTRRMRFRLRPAFAKSRIVWNPLLSSPRRLQLLERKLRGKTWTLHAGLNAQDTP
ncbi:hypothetical protein HPB52_004786 [Rhipicephalus sanguineus]|uniref:Uncharacterized protein n=1 Tax=Rhipicephalus sanguineus TaxID=34632 RepID=A0A9D4PBH5_RHISA|nr:hypothetical protein HPB52_004786 [Rhipicephalus sanguineus]